MRVMIKLFCLGGAEVYKTDSDKAYAWLDKKGYSPLRISEHAGRMWTVYTSPKVAAVAYVRKIEEVAV